MHFEISQNRTEVRRMGIFMKYRLWVLCYVVGVWVRKSPTFLPGLMMPYCYVYSATFSTVSWSSRSSCSISASSASLTLACLP